MKLDKLEYWDDEDVQMSRRKSRYQRTLDFLDEATEAESEKEASVSEPTGVNDGGQDCDTQ